MTVLQRQYTGCLLRPEDLPPSYPGFEVAGAFNPGAVEQGGQDWNTAGGVAAPVLGHDGRPNWLGQRRGGG